MFKVGDIVEPNSDAKDVNSKYLLGYPSDYYKVKDVGSNDILKVITVNDGFEGSEFYVIGSDWKMDEIYLRAKKLQKICSKLEI